MLQAGERVHSRAGLAVGDQVPPVCPQQQPVRIDNVHLGLRRAAVPVPDAQAARQAQVTGEARHIGRLVGGEPAAVVHGQDVGQGQRRVAAQWRTALGRELARRRPGRGLGAESRCPAEVKPDSADHIGF